MNIGVTFLIILAVPLVFQVVKLSLDQKKRDKDIIERLLRIEEKLTSDKADSEGG